MNHKLFGEYVQLTRDRSDMSQEEFADYLGCHQTTLSLIESGKRVKGGMIYKIASKLDVDLEDFLESRATDWNQWNYIYENKCYLRTLVENREYQSMGYYLDEWKKPIFHGKRDQVFYHWSHGIYDFHHLHNTNSSLQHLKEAFKLANTYESLSGQAEILNSHGLILLDSGDPEYAQHFLKKAERSLPTIHHRNHSTISTKILYNLSNTYLHQNKMRESHLKAFQAIQLCKETKSNFLQGELSYVCGYSSFHMGKIPESKAYMERSAIYLVEKGEQDLAHYVKNTMKQLGLDK